MNFLQYLSTPVTFPLWGIYLSMFVWTLFIFAASVYVDYRNKRRYTAFVEKRESEEEQPHG